MAEPNYFTLSADQLGLLEFVSGAPKSMMNMPVRINLESEIDEQKILEAVRITGKQLPYCTIRLHENEDGTTVQYYSDEEPEDIELVDMGDKTEEEIDEYILDLASTPFDNDYNDVQLYSFKLIRAPKNKHIMYLCAYHIIMDSCALIYTVTYIDKVYAALVNGTPLPPPGIGIEKHIEESWKYRNSPKCKKDIDWWVDNFKPEPHFTSMNPKGSPEYIEGKNYGKSNTLEQIAGESLPLRVPHELVDKINDAAVKANISPMIYYALALRTFLSITSETDDVTIATTGARRSTLMQKQCGVTTAHMISWRSNIGNKTPFSEACKQLSTSQKDVFRHIGSMLMEYETIVNQNYGVPEGCTYRTVVFTYQPYFNVENTHLQFDANHVNIGITFYPLYLNLMPHDGSGDMWADYIYSTDYIERENLLCFHDFMLKFIEDGINDPSLTIEALTERNLDTARVTLKK